MLLPCLVAIASVAQSTTTAFVGVNVIPMDRERVLSNQTVLIVDGKISRIGASAEVRVPAGAKAIDCKGKYLIPGLVDMHNHLFADSPEIADDYAIQELRVMLANGVTTSRLMNGLPFQLTLRDRIAKGELDLPNLSVSSPQLVGSERWATAEPNSKLVTTPEQARAAVQEFKKAGYEAVKMTMDIKDRAVYDAIMDECAKQGLPGIGHVDPAIDANHAIEKGQQIEHLDAYLEAILKDDSPIKTSVTQGGLFRKENWASLDHIDEAKLAAIAKKTADAKVYVAPSLAFLKMIYGNQITQAETRALPDFRFMPKSKVAEWDRALGIIYPRIAASEAHRKKFMRYRNELVRQIHANGGKIMAGSDSPDVYLFSGFSMHRELQCLVEAGLSLYAALEAGTRIPAEFLKASGRYGQVKSGLQADLVLLDANPLANIANTQKIAGVMLRGKWFEKPALAKMLDEAATEAGKLP
ncbi:MAG TPA: amidohydrolase family protein [Fimbriimonadaceae bacterium]|nr:amidohydrolase family protein [Fimbriimonadaceae bacterium]